MTPSSRGKAYARADEVKRLMLRGAPFASELARLYTDLRLAARYADLLKIYRFLLTFAPEGTETELAHPAVAQAFMAQKNYRQAEKINQTLLAKNPADPEARKLALSLQTRRETQIPPYTPLAALSKYAQKRCAERAPSGPLPRAWKRAADRLTPQKLQEIHYFSAKTLLARAPKARRDALERCFDELTLNYLFDNRRAVAALSGAFLEMLLTAYLQNKLKLKKITLTEGLRKNAEESSLHELIAFCAEKRLLPEHILRLGRVARMQRNFIHPGKELTSDCPLTPAATRVCWLAVLELTDALLSPAKRAN